MKASPGAPGKQDLPSMCMRRMDIRNECPETALRRRTSLRRVGIAVVVHTSSESLGVESDCITGLLI